MAVYLAASLFAAILQILSIIVERALPPEFAGSNHPMWPVPVVGAAVTLLAAKPALDRARRLGARSNAVRFDAAKLCAAFGFVAGLSPMAFTFALETANYLESALARWR